MQQGYRPNHPGEADQPKAFQDWPQASARCTAATHSFFTRLRAPCLKGLLKSAMHESDGAVGAMEQSIKSQGNRGGLPNPRPLASTLSQHRFQRGPSRNLSTSSPSPPEPEARSGSNGQGTPRSV